MRDLGHWSAGVRVLAETGMSLLEVTVAMGMASVLMLGVMELTTYSGRNAKSVSLGSDWNNLVASVRLVLNSENACKLALSGRTFDPAASVPVDTLTIAGDAIATTGLPAIGLKVTGLKMGPTAVPPVPVMVGSPPVSYTRYFSKFTMTAQKIMAGGGAAVGNNNYSQDFNFNVLTDSHGVIQSCYGEFSPAQACADLGGNYNEALTPKCQLSALKIYGGAGLGGNLPHNCQWVLGGGPGAGASPAHLFSNCPGSQIAVGGGGNCPEGVGVSMTVNGPHPGGPGTTGTAWGITCEKPGGVTGTIYVNAYCCDI